MKELARSESIFDSMKTVDEQGNEYWSARDLMPVMGYDTWQRFEDAIQRAKITCQNSGYRVEDVFSDAAKNPSDQGGRPAKDYRLTRYAAYLVAMNGDPRKSEIANAQTYFAIKTREAEALEGEALISRALVEAHKILARRDEKIRELQHEIEVLAPEVIAYRDCLGQIDTLNLRDAASILAPIHGMGPLVFLSKLREDGIIYHRTIGGNKINYPTVEVMQDGLFKVVPSGYTTPYGLTIPKAVITRTGLDYLVRKYGTASAVEQLKNEISRGESID